MSNLRDSRLSTLFGFRDVPFSQCAVGLATALPTSLLDISRPDDTNDSVYRKSGVGKHGRRHLYKMEFKNV